MLGACKKPDGKLSGVVTYYFNANYGDKPDVGAKIYIANRNDVDSSKVTAIEKYIAAKIYMRIIEQNMTMITLDSSVLQSDNDFLKSPYSSADQKERYKNAIANRQKDIAGNQINIEKNWTRLKEIKINSEKDYDHLSELASAQVMDFKISKYSQSFIADGAGSYSTNLTPGKYFVLIVSNHREGHSSAELLGQLKFNHETVESEKEVTSNANFY